MCKYSCEDAEIVFYSNGRHHVASPTPGQSILGDLTQYSQESSYLGSAPVSETSFCFDHANTYLKEKVHVDNMIVVTGESLISQPSDQGVRGLMKKFRSLVNPHLVLTFPT